MNNKKAEEIYKNMASKLGDEKVHNMVSGMFDLFCMMGDKNALAMKNCQDISKMINNEMDKHLVPNFGNEEIVEKFYKFTSALKEQTKRLIEDFDKEMEI